jgi:nanoRNase/pAp phosphatase (c-di-AMP/oligoRNAs hydrolase)
MEAHGGGGHRSVGGANARSLEDARRIAREVAAHLRAQRTARRP